MKKLNFTHSIMHFTLGMSMSLCFLVGHAMAVSAQSLGSFFDEGIVIRSMGAVATKTFPFFHRGMLVLL